MGVQSFVDLEIWCGPESLRQYQNFRPGRGMHHAREIVAQPIGLSPVSENGKA